MPLIVTAIIHSFPGAPGFAKLPWSALAITVCTSAYSLNKNGHCGLRILMTIIDDCRPFQVETWNLFTDKGTCDGLVV